MLRLAKLILQALLSWTNKNNINMQFIWPVKGRISAPFGLRKYFNNQPRDPHSGIDIAVKKHTPVKSPASGLVILTGNYFFRKNLTISGFY